MPELPARPSSVSNCTATAGSTVVPCNVSSVIVEFRTQQAHADYYGEFGFDWLRVKEAPTTELSYVDGWTGSARRYGIVLGGYKDDTHDYNKEEAQNKWKGNSASNGEYEKFLIIRSGNDLINRQIYYYVPYLNLYPKGVSATPINYTDTSVSPAVNKVAPKPPNKAKLRMIIDIKGSQSPERVEIEFNTLYFEIRVDGTKVTSPYIIPAVNYTLTPNNANTSRPVRKADGKLLIIEISCIQEFSEDQRIEVYAYHKKSGSSSNPTELEKKLAGKLVVCKNSRANRKTLKMVFVKVKTNFRGTAAAPRPNNTGDFANTSRNNKEIDMIYNVLYQALIYPIITTKKRNATTGRDEDIILDLTADTKFKTVAAGGTGNYVNAAGTEIVRGANFNKHIQDKFFRDYPEFASGYFTVFSFNETTKNASGNTVLGNVYAETIAGKSVFQKSVTLFTSRRQATLSHEGLHGLKLRHTHPDHRPLKYEQTKYIFAKNTIANDPKATTNIMSYNQDRFTTWRWQWLIMRDNV